MTEPVDRDRRASLEYHRAVSLADRVVALLRVEYLAIAVTLSGFSIGYFFGRPTDRRDLIAHFFGLVGLLMLFGGTMWYVILRVSSRALMPFWLRAQLVVAAGMSLLGPLAVVMIADQASEGPRGLQYWLTYNQTYAYNPVRALQAAWTTVVGVLWFVLVLIVNLIFYRPVPASPRPGN